MITILPARSSSTASDMERERVLFIDSCTASSPFSIAEKMDAKQVEEMGWEQKPSIAYACQERL
jgi:hypothetical protein